MYFFRVLGLYKLIATILQSYTLFFRIVDFSPPLPVVFPSLGFPRKICVFIFSSFLFLCCLLFCFFLTIGIRASCLISAMATIKYNIPLLDQNTRLSLWQVKMCVILAQMDLDDALLGFDKMPLSWTKEEKQRKDRKALSHIHLHLSNQILQDVLKEKTATTLWLKLKQLCMTKSLPSKLHLKQ